jgi:hypothetical protein
MAESVDTAVEGASNTVSGPTRRVRVGSANDGLNAHERGHTGM